MGKRNVTDTEIKDALIQSGGILARAARDIETKTGKVIKRSSLSTRCSNSPALQEARAQARENIVDQAEEGLFQAVKAQKSWAIKYVLSRLGKERGYTTTVKVDAHVETSGKVVILLPDNGRDKPNG